MFEQSRGVEAIYLHPKYKSMFLEGIFDTPPDYDIGKLRSVDLKSPQTMIRNINMIIGNIIMIIYTNLLCPVAWVSDQWILPVSFTRVKPTHCSRLVCYTIPTKRSYICEKHISCYLHSQCHTTPKGGKEAAWPSS